jgi:hypothetical protein
MPQSIARDTVIALRSGKGNSARMRTYLQFS